MMTEHEKWMEGYELLRYDKAQELYDTALSEVLAVVNHAKAELSAGEVAALARMLSAARLKVFMDGEENAETRQREYRGAVYFLYTAYKIKTNTWYALTDLLDDHEAVEGLLAMEGSKSDD